MQWQKADVTPEQLRTDEEECRQMAWREASVRSWRYQSAMGPIVARDASGRSILLWPSSSVVDPYAYQMLDEYRLAQFCMEAKGYQLVPAPKQ